MAYVPENYTNDNFDYVVGFSSEYQNCHLFDGDSFRIRSAGVPGKYTLEYNAVVLRYIDKAAAEKCYKFWQSVLLTYDDATGILTGEGDDQFYGAGKRYVSVALDRSHKKPYVVHVYVSKRNVAGGPPEDGSATGTGKQQ